MFSRAVSGAGLPVVLIQNIHWSLLKLLLSPCVNFSKINGTVQDFFATQWADGHSAQQCVQAAECGHNHVAQAQPNWQVVNAVLNGFSGNVLINFNRGQDIVQESRFLN